MHTHICWIWHLKFCCIFGSFHVSHLLHTLGKAAIVALDIEGGTEQAQAGKGGSATDPNGSENGGCDPNFWQFSCGKCDFKPLYSIFRIRNSGLPFRISSDFPAVGWTRQTVLLHWSKAMHFKSQRHPWLGLIFSHLFELNITVQIVIIQPWLYNSPFIWDSSGTLLCLGHFTRGPLSARTQIFHCSRHLKIANFGSVGFIRFQPHLSSSFFPMVFHGFPLTSWKHKINFPHGFPIGSRAGAPLCAPCQSGVVPSAAGGDGSWRVSLMFCYEWGYDMTWYDIDMTLIWHWYDIDMTWHDMTWYDMIWYDMIWYV